MIDVTNPELTLVPVFGEGVHAEFPREVIFGLGFQVFELLLPCVAIGVKFFEGVEGAG